MQGVLAALLTWDEKVFLWINGLSDSWLDYLFAWPTFYGDALLFVPLTLFFIWIWSNREKFRTRAIYIVLNVFTMGVLARILKSLVDRDRPYAYFYDAIDKGEVSVNYLFQMHTANSFPSGHTVTVFAVAYALFRIFGFRVIWIYDIAIWIAFTRIYIGAHFPLDVLAGACVGTFGAIIFTKLYEKRFSLGK